MQNNIRQLAEKVIAADKDEHGHPVIIANAGVELAQAILATPSEVVDLAGRKFVPSLATNGTALAAPCQAEGGLRETCETCFGTGTMDDERACSICMGRGSLQIATPQPALASVSSMALVSTAPRDGRSIILYGINSYNEEWAVIGHWSEIRGYKGTDGDWLDDDSHSHLVTPTHWAEKPQAALSATPKQPPSVPEELGEQEAVEIMAKALWVSTGYNCDSDETDWIEEAKSAYRALQAHARILKRKP